MRKETLLVMLVSVYIAAQLVSNATAGRLVEVAGFVFPGAIFLFALTFTLRDAVHTVGGWQVARGVIWAGVIANLILAGYGLLVNALPHPGFFNPDAYNSVFGTTIRVVFASLVAYWVSTYLDTYIFEKYKRSLAGRVMMSNLASTTTDTVIFIVLAFAGTGAPLVNLIVGQIIIKLVFSTVLIPLVYWVRNTLRRQGMALESY